MTSTPTTAAAALYEALRRIADAPQDAELDLGRGDARAIIRNLLAEVEAHPEPPADAHARRLAALAGTDPLAYVLVRPGENDTANIDAGSRGMSRAVAAYMLRQVADRFDVQARAEGDEPIPYGPTADTEAQQPATDGPQPSAEDTPAVPTVGARYEKHTGPNAGRTITITRVWADDDGPAVAYKWDAPHAGGGACPLAVFQRSYRPATGTTAP
jgi:hypothetical protein